MASSSIQTLGKHSDDNVTGQSVRFKVLSSAIKSSDGWISFPGFTVEEHLWLIECLPVKGDMQGEIHSLTLNLFYKGEWNNVVATFDMSMLKKDEQLSSVPWKTITHMFPKYRSKFELEKFVQGDELEKYLKEDYFVVVCNIKILSVGTKSSDVTISSLLTGISRNHSFQVSSLENKNVVSKSVVNKERETSLKLTSGLIQLKIVGSQMIENVGEERSSSMFLIGEHSWCIQYEYDTNGCLSFYLVIASAIKDLKVSLEFGMLRKDEEISSVKWKTATDTLEKCWDLIPMYKFVEGDEMKKYLQDDYFRVICVITIFSETRPFNYDVSILDSTEKPKPQPTKVTPYVQELQDSVSALKLQLKEKYDLSKEAGKLSLNKVWNFTEFSPRELKEATNNFDKSCIIGEGGFGTVYKGFLRYTKVAIKILKSDGSVGNDEFEQEIIFLD